MLDQYFRSGSRIAIVGSYVPRQCGIATFTYDLYSALEARAPGSVTVVAVSDEGEEYAYPDEVRHSLHQQQREDYVAVARELNQAQINRLSLQHEFGIYGGPAGEYVLDLVRNLTMPVITTFHTVLDAPSPAEFRVMAELLARSSRVVVMSQRGKEILRDFYGAPEWKVEYVPHGAHDLSKLLPENGQAEKHVANRLLTFGLLSPDKGIENVIKALPKILESVPDATYVIAGATHPKIRATQGEAYRQSLIDLAERLNVADHVQFINRYASLPELAGLLASATIYITPYLKPQQITSGTLAYAMGCGRAIISTPYTYANEVLANGRGALVPFANPDAIASEAIELLNDPQKRMAMQAKALRFGRMMLWPLVAWRYWEIFEETDFTPQAAAWEPLPPELDTVPLTLPRRSTTHLLAMSDSTGLLQHARYGIPNYTEGYCLDDNVRALFVKADSPELVLARQRNMAFIAAAFNPENGRFRNFMTYHRTWMEEAGSEDSHGRALWALGEVAAESPGGHLAAVANQLLFDAIGVSEGFRSPRAIAYTLLGLTAYIRGFGLNPQITGLADQLNRRLLGFWEATASGDWPWFEASLSYDNARLPQALLVSSEVLESPRALGVARTSLEWLSSLQVTEEGHFEPVGSAHPYERGGEKPRFDQQPVDVWASVSAYLDAGRILGEKRWVDLADRAYRWFLGENCQHQRMFDPDTGGGYDGLRPCGVNRNMGAESTLSFLLATQEIQATRTEPLLAFDRFALV